MNFDLRTMMQFAATLTVGKILHSTALAATCVSYAGSTLALCFSAATAGRALSSGAPEHWQQSGLLLAFSAASAGTGVLVHSLAKNRPDYAAYGVSAVSLAFVANAAISAQSQQVLPGLMLGAVGLGAGYTIARLRDLYKFVFKD